MKYELHLTHLYGNLLNTYSDIGNILTLQYYAKQMDTRITSTVVSLDQQFDPDNTDLVLFGGGQDLEQKVVSNDIQAKKDAIIRYIEDDGPMLAVCGGYQLLGEYYVGADGTKIKGIHALDHRTETQENNRFIGDIKIKNAETGQIYHGFENHNGMTFLGKDERPLGQVIEGHGNNGQDGTEGAIHKNTFCTYFHGPVLARNGELAKRLLITALKRKYPDADLSAAEALAIKPTY